MAGDFRHVAVSGLKLGNDLPLTLIAGPCAMENRQHALDVSGKLAQITDRLGIGLIYKTSFDKANRTSSASPRGVGLEEAIPVFSEIRDTVGCPVLTDVHTESQCAGLETVVDVLQIPAFLCRQTDLLLAAAHTGCVVNVKKGQFLAPWDMKYVAEKISSGRKRKYLADGARGQLWVQHSGERYAIASPSWPKPDIRWYLMRRIPCSNLADWGPEVAGTVSWSRSWPAPPLRSAWLPYLWKRTKILTTLPRMVQIWCAWMKLRQSSADLWNLIVWPKD